MKPQQEIDKLKEEIDRALERIGVLCDAHGIKETIDILDSVYTYYPEKMSRERAIEIIESGEALDTEMREQIVATLKGESDYDDWSSSFRGWMSSSDMC